MSMNLALILFLLINGISCLENGKPVDQLPSYSNFLATIWTDQSSAPLLLCSGTMISASHVLTAGHCVHDFNHYDLYVSHGGPDLNHGVSTAVHRVYLHDGFEKVVHPQQGRSKKLLPEYWLNDIAILQLVYEFSWNSRFAPLMIYFQNWINAVNQHCYIIGYNIHTITRDAMGSTMPLQWADALILGDNCEQPEILRQPNEIYVLLTESASHNRIQDTDIGTPFVCGGGGVGILVGTNDQARNLAAVLTIAPYHYFIAYIIAGGWIPVESETFKDVVEILKAQEFLCSGFMVYSGIVVTAAHCVQNVERHQLSVNLPNSSPLNYPGWSLVESVQIHPHYRVFPSLMQDIIENDIAVLKLEVNMLQSSEFRVADFLNLNPVFVGSTCEILRWSSSSTDPNVKQLMMSFSTVINDDLDNESVSKQLPQLFRVKGKYGMRPATTKDIGSPVLFNNDILGMVIAIDESVIAGEHPVICLKIKPYIDFINTVV